MLQNYNYIVEFKVEVECLSPVRSGNFENDTEAVLRRHDGKAFVQATSLAGAFSEWLKNIKNKNADMLIGNIEREGCLIFSDLVFEADSKIATRPRLKIDGRTGTASDGAKFDLTHIQKGTKGEFTLVLFALTEEEKDEYSETVRKMLSALDSGEIKLGAQKNNGFGRLKVSAVKQEFDLKNELDRRAWLDDSNDASVGEIPVELDSVNSQKVKFKMTGKLKNVLVKDSVTDYEGDNSIQRNIYEGDNPVIPGSSIKGAVRSRVEMIAEYIGVNKKVIDCYFGGEAELDPETNTKHGSAGKVSFSDITLEKPSKEIKTTRIRINKFTGGVMSGALFAEEPVASDIDLEIEAVNDPGLCALLLFALRDLGIGLYNLGSSYSIGRGFIENAEISVLTPDGKEIKISCNDGKCVLEDKDGLWNEWYSALEAIKKEED